MSATFAGLSLSNTCPGVTLVARMVAPPRMGLSSVAQFVTAVRSRTEDVVISMALCVAVGAASMLVKPSPCLRENLRACCMAASMEAVVGVQELQLP